MSEAFVEMLRGARNNLGRTEEVVDVVLQNPERIDELYDCYFQPDEWVRLRTSSSFKRIWRADNELFLPFLDRFVKDISKIDQPSAQWTFAEMCSDLDEYLSGAQRRSAKTRIKKYLETSDDWIVQNRSIETLSTWALDDQKLREWILPKLVVFADGERKSVARRAQSWLNKLKDRDPKSD